MQTLRKWDKDGKLIPTHTLGGHRRYRQADVDKIVAGMTDGPVKTVELLNEALSYVQDGNVKKRIEKIIEALDAQYGTDFICYLEHKNALELLIATILSAQCTDARVNTVTPTLFAKYKNAQTNTYHSLTERRSNFNKIPPIKNKFIQKYFKL
jgi:hypothetical protein